MAEHFRFQYTDRDFIVTELESVDAFTVSRNGFTMTVTPSEEENGYMIEGHGLLYYGGFTAKFAIEMACAAINRKDPKVVPPNKYRREMQEFLRGLPEA